jgi:hypothetical protein
MTDRNIARWLLVALAIVGLAFAVPAVSAHGDAPVQENETATDGMPVDGETAERTTWTDGHMTGQTDSHVGDEVAGTPVDGEAAAWATWMEAHMTDHMGPNAVNQMETYTGVTVDEMARDMADDDHNDHTTVRTSGRGYGC